MRLPVVLLAGAIALATGSCAVGRVIHPPAVMIGGDWQEALPKIRAWASSENARRFQFQDLDADSIRVYPALDSLLIADAWRRAGLDHPMLRRLPPAPPQAGILCRENYIFYLRGNRIVGVEYRAIVSDGWGGHRQSDEAVGEISASPPTSA